MLYSLLGAQIIVSAITFSIYFIGNPAGNFFLSKALHYSDVPFFNFTVDLAPALFYVYAVIVLYRIFAVYRQYSDFKNQFQKNLIKPSAELKVFTSLNACRLGIKGKVHLYYSSLIKAPLTFGFFKPYILLPICMVNNISIQEAESIILHELTHIKSRDYLYNSLMIAADIVYFFNPFIKIITAKIKSEREKNCDVQVINFNYDPLQYAETLLKIARLSNGIKEFQIAAVHRKPQLLQRIHFFSAKKNMVFNKCGGSAISALCISFVIAATALVLPAAYKILKESSAVNSPSIGSTKNSPLILRESPEEKYAVYKNTVPYYNKRRGIFKKEDKYKAIDAEIVTSSVPALAAIGVAYNEMPDSTKEFIYKEETPQGKVTQSFKITLVKGEWIMQPQWMIVETKPDTTVVKPLSSVQHLSETPQ